MFRRRLLSFGFRLLYNELAWLYDPVSWIVSLGRWRAWQQTIWPYLPPEGRILEVGPGPGHLLADLAAAGYYHPLGLEPSRSMLGLAARTLRRRGQPVTLCRGRANALPLRRQIFNGVVSTFPTPYIYDPAWMGELVRVLTPGGRLIVVESISFLPGGRLSHTLEQLYRVTGQSPSGPDLPRLLGQAGLRAWRDGAEVHGSLVHLVLAEKS
jgi:ubiquinone/menaquinone biosynthesis C-methylase UbiE